MSKHRISPEGEIHIGAKTYRLKGSFTLVRDIEHAMDRDIVAVYTRLIAMRTSDLVKLIAVAINGSGYEVEEQEIGEAIFSEIGLNGRAMNVLRAELVAWLGVVIAPPDEREKKSKEMAARLDAMRQAAKNPDSPGETTSDSVSGS